MFWVGGCGATGECREFLPKSQETCVVFAAGANISSAYHANPGCLMRWDSSQAASSPSGPCQRIWRPWRQWRGLRRTSRRRMSIMPGNWPHYPTAYWHAHLNDPRLAPLQGFSAEEFSPRSGSQQRSLYNVLDKVLPFRRHPSRDTATQSRNRTSFPEGYLACNRRSDCGGDLVS